MRKRTRTNRRRNLRTRRTATRRTVAPTYIRVGGNLYKKASFDWVTDEMFDRALEEILDDMTGAEILATPGAYEVFSEELNNEVLEKLEEEREGQ